MWECKICGGFHHGDCPYREDEEGPYEEENE